MFVMLTILVLHSLLLGSGASNPQQTSPIPETELITRDNASQLRELAVIGRGTIDQISLSPDGGQLAVVNRMGIDLIDLRDPTHPARRIASEYSPILNTLFHPDWEYVVVSTPYRLSMVDLQTGNEIRELDSSDRPHSPHLLHFDALEMVLSPDYRWLGAVSGREGSRAQVWDLQTGNLLAYATFRYMVSSPVFTANGDRFAFAYNELSPRYNPYSIWSSFGTEMWDPVEWLDTGGHTFEAFDWNYWEPGSEVGPFNAETPSIWRQPNGSVLVSTTRSQQTEVWDASSARSLGILPPEIVFLGFSPDGDLVLTDTERTVLRLANPFDWDESADIALEGGLVTWAISSDGTTIALVDDRYDITVMDLRTRETTRSIAARYLGPVMDVIASPSSPFVYVADGRTNLRRVDLDSQTLETLAYIPDAATRLAILEPRSLVAWGEIDGSVALMNYGNGDMVWERQGHSGAVRDVAISPDGRYLASIGDDSCVIVWTAADGSSHPLTCDSQLLAEHVEFNSDSTVLAILDYDGSPGTRVFDIGSGNVLVSWDDVTLEGLYTLSEDYGFYASDDVWRNRVGDLVWPVDPTLPGVWLRTMGVPTVALSWQEGDINFAFSTDLYSQVLNHLELWVASSGEQLASFDGFPSDIYGVAFPADRSLLVFGGRDGAIRVWGVPATGEH